MEKVRRIPIDAGKKAGEVLPFYVLSRNYDPRTGGV